MRLYVFIISEARIHQLKRLLSTTDLLEEYILYYMLPYLRGKESALLF